MSDLRETMALLIDDGVRQALRDYGISDEAMRAFPELLPSALLTADAALAAIEAAGFTVVPREPTRDMQRYGAAEMWQQETAQPGVVGYQQAAAIYTAMLAKAAKP